MNAKLKISTYTLIAAAMTAGMTLAQGPGGGGRPPHGPPPGGPGGPGGERENDEKPPMPPLLEAMDKDSDGSISEDELSSSAESLKALDQNKDGSISEDELRPAPPQGKGEGEDDRESKRRKPPVPPLMKALDIDEDGALSEDEIEQAPESLAELDHNKNGTLSKMEIRPKRRFKRNRED